MSNHVTAELNYGINLLSKYANWLHWSFGCPMPEGLYVMTVEAGDFAYPKEISEALTWFAYDPTRARMLEDMKALFLRDAIKYEAFDAYSCKPYILEQGVDNYPPNLKGSFLLAIINTYDPTFIQTQEVQQILNSPTPAARQEEGMSVERPQPRPSSPYPTTPVPGQERRKHATTVSPERSATRSETRSETRTQRAEAERIRQAEEAEAQRIRAKQAARRAEEAKNIRRRQQAEEARRKQEHCNLHKPGAPRFTQQAQPAYFLVIGDDGKRTVHKYDKRYHGCPRKAKLSLHPDKNRDCREEAEQAFKNFGDFCGDLPPPSGGWENRYEDAETHPDNQNQLKEKWLIQQATSGSTSSKPSSSP